MRHQQASMKKNSPSTNSKKCWNAIQTYQLPTPESFLPWDLSDTCKNCSPSELLALTPSDSAEPGKATVATTMVAASHHYPHGGIGSYFVRLTLLLLLPLPLRCLKPFPPLQEPLSLRHEQSNDKGRSSTLPWSPQLGGTEPKHLLFPLGWLPRPLFSHHTFSWGTQILSLFITLKPFAQESHLRAPCLHPKHPACLEQAFMSLSIPQLLRETTIPSVSQSKH